MIKYSENKFLLLSIYVILVFFLFNCKEGKYDNISLNENGKIIFENYINEVSSLKLSEKHIINVYLDNSDKSNESIAIMIPKNDTLIKVDNFKGITYEKNYQIRFFGDDSKILYDTILPIDSSKLNFKTYKIDPNKPIVRDDDRSSEIHIFYTNGEFSVLNFNPKLDDISNKLEAELNKN